jgi:ribosome biogenesis GTPase
VDYQNRTSQNYLIRKSVNLSKEAHIIASNLDLACIIFTLQSPETSLGFLDRFLACCEAYNIPVLILFNKIDLLNFEEVELVEELQTMYENLGYQTLQVSSENNLNLDKLQEILKDKTCVFFGHSGAGKSTLANALQPDLNLKTNEISETHNKGNTPLLLPKCIFGIWRRCNRYTWSSRICNDRCRKRRNSTLFSRNF